MKDTVPKHIQEIKEIKKEENGLFNGALNTILNYLTFIVVWHRTYDKGPIK